MTSYSFGQYIIQASRVCFKSPLSFGIVSGYKKPVLPGHVLVCTLRRVERLRDMTSDEVHDLFQSVHIISSALQTQLGVKDLSVGLQDGVDAGQSVRHVHIHIVPRTRGDFKRDEINPLIRENACDPRQAAKTRELRTDEEMAQEAMELRKLFPDYYTKDL